MFSRLLLVILISIILTSKTNAETCDAYFPDTVQGHASGSEIEFEDEGLILGDIDNHFLFSELDDETENSHKTCGVSDCTVSGGSAPAIELPDFEATNNGNDLTIEGWGAPLTIDDSEIQKLTITDGAKVTFLSTGSPFKIKEGIFKEQSKITLQTGVYWFNELTIQNDVKIYIEGPVIIYVKTDLLIKNQAQVNFNKNSNGQNGDGEAKDLVFVTWSDDVELIDNVKVRALLYSKSVEMSEEAKFIGAISVEDELSIENEATVYYEDVSGAICGAPTPTLPEAKVEWRFDECTYTGSGNEVIDHSNNGYDATIHGITSPVQGQINNALDLSASGTNDWVSVPRKAIHNLNDFTVSVWINTSISKDQQNIIHALGKDKNDDELEIAIIDDDEVYIKVRDNPATLDSNITLDDGNWHHIALTRVGKDVCLFVDGSQQECDDNEVNSGTLKVPHDAVVHGQEQDKYGGDFSSAQSFEGLLDEFKIFSKKLTNTQITSIYDNEKDKLNYDGTERAPVNCSPEIDHYEIIHDGSGLTCAAEAVIINACTNSDCSSLSAEAITLDLQATGPLSGTTTKNSVAFNNGSTTVALNHFIAETLTLSVKNENIPATNNTVCSGTIGASCDITFFDSGFIFDIPTQTSCAISDEITISAVRKNSTSEQCLPSFSNVQKTLKFWSRYDSPATGTKQVTLKQNSTDYPLPSTEGSEVPIAFDTNGQATFKVTYPDAGRLALNASYDGSGSEQGLRMIGNDLFVSAPAKLVVSSNDNDADCSSADANCNAFKVAGATFNLSISATCDDPNNTVTPNFQMNDIALSVKTIAPVLLLPNPVALAVNSIDITEADKGVHTENAQTISEVGVFTITATPPDNGYLGETIAAATSTNIGRFIPSYFEVGGIDNGVLSGGHPFVYSGQMVSPTSSIGQISYDINPEFTLTAKSLTDSTTLNYTDDFIKLLISGVDRKIPTHDAIQRGADGVNEVDLSAALGLPVLEEFSPGVLKYQFNSTDNYVYTRNANALIPPFTATINLQINSIKDSDNVIAKDIDTDTTNGILTLQPQGSEIRFGRWVLENSYGSETTDLRMPMLTQYWNGSYFVTNNLDGFTSFNATDASIMDNQLKPASASPYIWGAGLFFEGETNNLTIESPGINTRGSVTVQFNVPPWLQYDWTVSDYSYDENPTGLATFGLYRGNDRIIYRQEVFE